MEKSAALVLIMNGDMVLGFNRKGLKPGYALPGGKTDPDETIEQTAIREAREELGEEVELYKEVPYIRTLGDRVVYTFKAKIIGKADIERFECEGDPEWVQPYKLSEGPFGEYNIKMFHHFEIDPFLGKPV